MTREEYEAYNKSRACTKENFLRRHGEVEGIKRWHDYCYREFYTNSLNYYMQKYGEDGKTKWEAMINSKRTNVILKYHNSYLIS